MDEKPNADIATPTLPACVWPWSKEAVAAFMMAATDGGKKLNVRKGMDAALVEDLAGIAFAMARFWVETLTGPEVAPIIFKVKQEGKEVILHADREFLMRVCCLEVPPDGGLVIEKMEPPKGGLIIP